MKNKVSRFTRTIEEYITLLLSSVVNIRFRHNIDSGSTDIHRIVVIKLDHIGDVILSIPALANIRHRFPDANITMVVNPSTKPISELIPYVDDVVCYNARFFDRFESTKMLDVLKGIRFAVNMRGRDFDLIVDLRGSFASLLFATISKSRYRIDRGSYLIKRKLNRSNLDTNVKKSFAIKQKGDNYPLDHEAEISLDILSKAGIDIVTKKISLKDTYLSSFSKEDLVIVIHPGGPMLQKRWSANNYISLICMILERFNSHIYLIGGKDESELVKSILASINDERVVDLSGKLSLEQLVSTLKKSDIFIGNDSGPMHIASACGIRVIGLYGPTDPRRFGPYGENCIALRREENCPPCSHGKCKFSGYRCIDQISVEDVINTINEMLLNT